MEVVSALKCKLTNCQFLTPPVLEISFFLRVSYVPETVPSVVASNMSQSTVVIGREEGLPGRKVFTDLD